MYGSNGNPFVFRQRGMRHGCHVGLSMAERAVVRLAFAETAERFLDGRVLLDEDVVVAETVLAVAR